MIPRIAKLKRKGVIHPKAKPKLWHGAVQVYRDGRERCTDTQAGRVEYELRRRLMRDRQNNLCCLCGQWMDLEETSFEHENGRGGGKRDDRIIVDGKRHNGGSHGICNMQRGSSRTPFLLQ